MIEMTLAEIAESVSGRLVGGADPRAVVTGPVVVDSRAAVPGGLFAALRGERVDGHEHAAAALAAGAVAAVVAREAGVPGVLVADPLVALGELARAVVDRARRLRAGDLTVVGITGSSGKTSTKDLVAGLLARLGSTVAPEGSFNNELGVPLTALRTTPDTRFLVAEMGARNPGNIAYLCGITPPRIGVVLNVGAAHAGVFGSREVTARTKGELVEALPADGVAVLNSDDPLVAAMAGRSRGRVVGVGAGSGAEVRAERVRLDGAARPRFRLVTPEGAAEVALAVHGRHNVGNALAAAAVARELGMPVDRVAAALEEARIGSRWRMEVTTRDDGVTVVNDAYNANPDSVRAALEALVAMGSPGDGEPRRTWAVLGEMLELGAESAAEHEATGRLAARLGVDRLVGVGEGARMIHEGARAARADGAWCTWAADSGAALEQLRDGLRPGDVVLVKASRAVGLDRVAAELLAVPAGPDGDLP